MSGLEAWAAYLLWLIVVQAVAFAWLRRCDRRNYWPPRWQRFALILLTGPAGWLIASWLYLEDEEA